MKYSILTKSIASVVVGAMLFACTPKQKDTSYTIIGIAGTELQDSTIVTVMQGGNQLATDTIQNGQFTFTGKADSITEVRVQANKRHYAIVYLEPGTITVDLSEKVATGTPLNDDYTFVVRALKETPEGTDPDSLERALCQNLYDKHRDNALGRRAFVNLCFYYDYDELKAALEVAPEAIRNDPTSVKRLEAKEQQAATAPGTRFIDICGIDAKTARQIGKDEEQGDSLALARFVGNGKPTLVDFWASWCGPCRAEIPNIAACAAKYGNKLNVVGIAVWDNLSQTQNAMKELNITWPVIFNKDASRPYGIQGIPHIMLIASDGTILERELRGKQIEIAIEKALR